MINIATVNYNGFPLRKSFYLFLGRAMPVIFLFFITILYSRKLTYEAYGKFQTVWMYVNVLNIITSFGITALLLSSNLASLFVFIKNHISRIVGGYGLLLIITSILFLLFGKNFTAGTKSLLIVFVVIQSTGSVTETLLVKSHREKIVFVINFIYAVLFSCWHYFILLRGFDLNNLIEGILMISTAKFVVMFLLVKKQYQSGIPIAAGAAINEHLYFKHWVYLGLNDITGVVSRWTDKLVLVYLLTAADFAVFFNGSFEIPLFGLLISVVGSVMLIEVSKDISSAEKVQELFKESFRLLSLVVFPVFLFLLFFRYELFAVMFKHKYDASIPVFLVSIFVLPARINNYSGVLQYYQQGNKIMYGSLLDISLALLLMVVLYPVFGTRGVALAIVIATYCQVLYYLWQSAKLLHTDILSLVPVKALSIILLTMLLGFTALYYGISKFSVEARLVTGLIATMIVILTCLAFHLTKKQPHSNGFAA